MSNAIHRERAATSTDGLTADYYDFSHEFPGDRVGVGGTRGLPPLGFVGFREVASIGIEPAGLPAKPALIAKFGVMA